MEVVSTDRAPAAIGPYSQAIKTDRFVFTSGQIPIDPATGKLAEGGVEQQAAQALKNLQAVLEAAGSSINNVVKTTVFLMDMADFAKVNEVYGRFFLLHLPARSAVQVAKLPKDSLIEIEAVAVIQ